MLKTFLKTNKKTYLLFSLFSVLILGPFLIDPNVIKKNDLNGNITPLLNFKQSLYKEKTLSQWNSYINQGIPQTADPLYGIYNPIISIPFILLPTSSAIKVIYALSIFLACASMFCLLRFYKTTYLISVLISLTYASSSYLAARIDAGHLEKIVSFGFLPLFLFSVLKIIKNRNILWSGITALIISLILFSGDIYNAMFALYSVSAILIYYLFKDKKTSLYLIISILLFLLFSSVKIIPMIELGSYISKIKEPFAGSQNFISIFYYLFFPYDLINGIIPTKLFLSNTFGWWESFSFIGPFSILGVFSIFKLSGKKNETIIFPILFILFILISMPNSALNPLHFLISSLSIFQFFHVPGRIFALQSVIILLCFGMFLNKYFNKKRVLVLSVLSINLFLTGVFFENVLTKQKFPEIGKADTYAVEYISKHNPSNYYALHFTSQGDIPQDTAFINQVLFLQSNYGLFIKGSPSDKFTFGKTPYDDITPGFIVTASDIKSIPKYTKVKDFKTKDINLYSTNNATPFAHADKNSYKAIISSNKIAVSAVTEKNRILTVIQNNYPGWSVLVDGKKASLIKSELLSVKTLKGNHKYEFIFFSKSFLFGFCVSLFSILFFAYYCYVVGKKRT